MEDRRRAFLDKMIKDFQDKILLNNEKLAFCSMLTTEPKPFDMSIDECRKKCVDEARKNKAEYLREKGIL